MFTDTMRLVPSARSTIRSTSRTGLPVASTSETMDRRTGVPSRSKKREVWLNSSCVCPGCGARPQTATAWRLYWRMVPLASQMNVAIGRRSRIPSDARKIALKADGIGRSVTGAVFPESAIRTPPRGPSP